MKHRLTRLGLGVISLTWAACSAQAAYSSFFIENSKAFGTAVADYNNDGHDDIFICGHDQDDRIWNSVGADGSSYTPGQFLLHISEVDRHDCAADDVNHDGRVDLYCALGAKKGEGTGNNQLWVQMPDGHLEQQFAHGAEDALGSGRRPIFFDFNHDTWPDIYLTNEQHAGGNISPNRLFINKGIHTGSQYFEENASTVATGTFGWACVAKGDINGDGWDDLLICNNTDATASPTTLFINDQNGNFNLVVPPAMLNKRVIWAVLRDLKGPNGNHLPDLIQVTSDNKLEVWFNSGSGQYFDNSLPQFEYSLGAPGKSVTVGQFNRSVDEFPDIYVARAAANCMKDKDPEDHVPDLMFWGHDDYGQWNAQVLVEQQAFIYGCANEVQTMDDDKVLLVNGTSVKGRQGDNFVIRWTN